MTDRADSVLSRGEIAEVIDRLASLYPHVKCALDHGSVWELLICVTLSAQTTDVRVNSVTPELFRRWPDAPSLAGADAAEVQEVIRSLGMYKTKSANIIRLAAKLIEVHDGLVPDDYDSLVALPGVGRKTANVVLAVGFGRERIAVDTHVFRVSNRIGLCREPDVLKTEEALMKNLPEGRLAESHHYLIWHGRQVCRARKPGCGECVLDDLCLHNR